MSFLREAHLPSRWAESPWLVSTRLAYSANGGDVFEDLALVNAAEDLPTEGQSLQNEVPSLVFDLSDPNAMARAKLIWFHYRMSDGTIDASVSWLALRSAIAPEFLSLSPEIKLLAGNQYDPNNSVSPGAPLFPLPLELADCQAVTEPGTLAIPNGFLMSLTCEGSQPAEARIEQVVFYHPPTGGTELFYAGRYLSPSDAAAFASVYGRSFPELQRTVGFDGTDLVIAGGQVFLLATPVNANGEYMGCAAFLVTDPLNASLQRINGVPSMLQYIQGIPNTHRGACTYSDKSSIGIELSQYQGRAAFPFTLVNTFVGLP